MIRSLEFQAGGFYVLFVELYCIGAISEQFPLVPGVSGKPTLFGRSFVMMSSCRMAKIQKVGALFELMDVGS